MRPLSDEDAPPARKACAHEDIRYSPNEKGAIACYACGRLFGHLDGETFHAFNPRLPAAELERYERMHWINPDAALQALNAYRDHT